MICNSISESNIEVFHKAVDNGVKIFNTATFYGPLNEDGYGTNLRSVLLPKNYDQQLIFASGNIIILEGIDSITTRHLYNLQ